MAALILGVGILIAGAWKLPDYRQLAQTSSPPAANQRFIPEPKMESVGRITGMVDCKWEEGAVERGTRGGRKTLPIPNP